MPAREPVFNRMISTALRRGRRSMGALPLLRKMASGDIIIPESVLNGVLKRANLDEELPLRWEEIKVRMYDGYFELDLKGTALYITGPRFRIQARFESVDVSLNQQVIRVRFLGDIETFAQGAVERLILLIVRVIFGRMLQVEGLVKTLDNGSPSITREAPDLVRIDLHEMPQMRKHLDGLVAGVAGRVLGRNTTLVKSIECHKGRLVIRTTTVAQELSRKGLRFGHVADEASKFMHKVKLAGQTVAGGIQDSLRPE